MFNNVFLGALTLLSCLWLALIFDVADIVDHLGKMLNILDND